MRTIFEQEEDAWQIQLTIAIINRKNTDTKCFQYATTVAME